MFIENISRNGFSFRGENTKCFFYIYFTFVGRDGVLVSMNKSHYIMHPRFSFLSIERHINLINFWEFWVLHYLYLST